MSSLPIPHLQACAPFIQYLPNARSIQQISIKKPLAVSQIPSSLPETAAVSTAVDALFGIDFHQPAGTVNSIPNSQVAQSVSINVPSSMGSTNFYAKDNRTGAGISNIKHILADRISLTDSAKVVPERAGNQIFKDNFTLLNDIFTPASDDIRKQVGCLYVNSSISSDTSLQCSNKVWLVNTSGEQLQQNQVEDTISKTSQGYCIIYFDTFKVSNFRRL